MSLTGIIVLAHGSRGERGKGEVEAALAKVAAGLKPQLASDVEIVGASLQFNHPDLEEATALLTAKGVKRILIAPFFLFPGRHITEHLPEMMKKLRTAYPEKHFEATDNLGLDESLITLMARRIKHSVPDLVPHIHEALPGPIERESMKIVESLLPSLTGLSENETTVVKRIVHACGDVDVARLVRFSPSAVQNGLDSIKSGRSIVTDVRMVLTGINKSLAKGFGCSVVCALDRFEQAAAEGNTTRTAAAINHLGAELNGAVVAIGNAPTALLALINLINNQRVKPGLVVGMPVGFVQAEESKQKLMKTDVPYVTVTGTRGGSPMAAAAINALLRIAAIRSGSNPDG